MLLLMLPTLSSLLDNDFMLTFGNIRSLRSHSRKCGSEIYILFLVLPSLCYLLNNGLMLPICSHVINSVSVTIIFILVPITPCSIVLWTSICYVFPHTLIYIFRNRLELLILWFYSSIFKTFKCVIIISCWI